MLWIILTAIAAWSAVNISAVYWSYRQIDMRLEQQARMIDRLNNLAHGLAMEIGEYRKQK